MWQVHTTVERKGSDDGLDVAAPGHASKEAALKEACGKLLHSNVSHISGPNGERIEPEEIRAWCKQHNL
jgi:hypothetical protein